MSPIFFRILLTNYPQIFEFFTLKKFCFFSKFLKIRPHWGRFSKNYSEHCPKNLRKFRKKKFRKFYLSPKDSLLVSKFQFQNLLPQKKCVFQVFAIFSQTLYPPQPAPKVYSFDNSSKTRNSVFFILKTDICVPEIFPIKVKNFQIFPNF